MASSAESVGHVVELLSRAGVVGVKRMFRGHGVYRDGLFMAIIANDELYLKVDDLTHKDFEAEGCASFIYRKDGKVTAKSYRRAPAKALDALHLTLPWARRWPRPCMHAQSERYPQRRRQQSVNPSHRRHGLRSRRVHSNNLAGTKHP